MAFRLHLWPAIATLLVVVISFFIRRCLQAFQAVQAAKKFDLLLANSPGPTKLCKSLASSLPDSIIFPRDVAAFKQSMNSYWAKQECEVIPACVVRPRDIHELCTAIAVLRKEYEEGRKETGERKAAGLFAVRSGGHSPASGAASIEGGVLLDLSLFCEVTLSKDESSVVIGTGARWLDVSRVLDEKGLAVVGGRNSTVGVGGLILGGKVCFFNCDTKLTRHKQAASPSSPLALV